MRSAENVENFIKRVRLKASAQMHKRTLNDALEAQEKSRKTKSAKFEPNIWRIIMKSRTTKLAAAAVIIIAVLGICTVGGPHVAFAQTTKAVRITLSRLKGIVIKMRTPDQAQEPARVAPPAPAKHVETSKPSYSIKYDLFVVQGQQANLRSFLEKQDIEFTPTTDNANICYAILDPERADRFTDLSRSTDELKLLMNPRLLIEDDHQGVVGTGDFAFTVAATLLDDNQHIDLSFSFHDGQTGFKIPGIRTKIGEAVLIPTVKTATANEDEGNSGENLGPDDNILILIRAEVLSPT